MRHPGLRLSDVAIGQALPTRTTPPITTRQLVEYAGASGDFNRIHYDDPFARAAGFPSVIAHGMLSMAQLGSLVAAWAGGPHAVVKLSARFRAVAFPGDVLECHGNVASIDETERTAVVALTVSRQDHTVVVDGNATIRLS